MISEPLDEIGGEVPLGRFQVDVLAVDELGEVHSVAVRVQHEVLCWPTPPPCCRLLFVDLHGNWPTWDWRLGPLPRLRRLAQAALLQGRRRPRCNLLAGGARSATTIEDRACSTPRRLAAAVCAAAARAAAAAATAGRIARRGLRSRLRLQSHWPSPTVSGPKSSSTQSNSASSPTRLGCSRHRLVRLRRSERRTFEPVTAAACRWGPMRRRAPPSPGQRRRSGRPSHKITRVRRCAPEARSYWQPNGHGGASRGHTGRAD